MTTKILYRWLIILFLYLLSITLYRFFVGPLSPYLPLTTPLVLLTLLPVSYLSMDWKYVQEMYLGGSFGEANRPIKSIVTIPGGIYNDIDIVNRRPYLAYLNRWVIYRDCDHPITIFYDRSTKSWYYHYQPSKFLVHARKFFKTIK